MQNWAEVFWEKVWNCVSIFCEIVTSDTIKNCIIFHLRPYIVSYGLFITAYFKSLPLQMGDSPSPWCNFWTKHITEFYYWGHPAFLLTCYNEDLPPRKSYGYHYSLSAPNLPELVLVTDHNLGRSGQVERLRVWHQVDGDCRCQKLTQSPDY